MVVVLIMVMMMVNNDDDDDGSPMLNDDDDDDDDAVLFLPSRFQHRCPLNEQVETSTAIDPVAEKGAYHTRWHVKAGGTMCLYGRGLWTSD